MELKDKFMGLADCNTLSIGQNPFNGIER